MIALAANLAACAVVGTSLLLLRSDDGEAGAAQPGPTSAPGTDPSATGPTAEPTAPPNSTPVTSAPPTEPGVPAGFQQVSGPRGITTLIPAGWQAKPREEPSTYQATDPSDATSFLRFGGSSSPSQPLLTAQKAGEADFIARYPTYKPIVFRAGKWRGHESVTWEFEFVGEGGRKHVESIFWRAGGVDYVLYASATIANWPKMKTIYTTAAGVTNP